MGKRKNLMKGGYKIMTELREMAFTCPFCGKEYMTYIEPSKLQRLLSRRELGKDIFRNYNAIYREIIISKECSQCQHEMPVDEEPEVEVYDIEIDSTNAEKEALKSSIMEMIEDCERV